MGEGKGGRSDQAPRTALLTWQCPFPRGDRSACSANVQPPYPTRMAAYQHCCVLLSVLFLPLVPLCRGGWLFTACKHSLANRTWWLESPPSAKKDLSSKQDRFLHLHKNAPARLGHCPASCGSVPGSRVWVVSSTRSTVPKDHWPPSPPSSQQNTVLRSRKMFFNWRQKLSFWNEMLVIHWITVAQSCSLEHP